MKNKIDVVFDTDEKLILLDVQELIEKNYPIHTTENGMKVQIQGTMEFDFETRTKTIRLEPLKTTEPA